MKAPEELAGEYAGTITTSCCGTSDFLLLLIEHDLIEQAIRWAKTTPSASERCNQCAVEGYKAGYKAAQPQWISVKDRLPPEQDNQSLFLSIYKDVYLGGIELVSTDFGEFHLTYNGGHGYLDRADKLISHWMPLPPAPEKEK
jgi:hypothetical protein